MPILTDEERRRFIMQHAAVGTEKLEELLKDMEDTVAFRLLEGQTSTNKLVRELDVLLNGEGGAAPQASLCDLVSQVHAIVQATGKPLLVSHVKAPIELTDHQVSVLGRPNFRCGTLAALLVNSGAYTKPKESRAEIEQAMVIHFLMGFLDTHGAQWQTAAEKRIKQLEDSLDGQL